MTGDSTSVSNVGNNHFDSNTFVDSLVNGFDQVCHQSIGDNDFVHNANLDVVLDDNFSINDGFQNVNKQLSDKVNKQLSNVATVNQDNVFNVLDFSSQSNYNVCYAAAFNDSTSRFAGTLNRGKHQCDRDLTVSSSSQGGILGGSPGWGRGTPCFQRTLCCAK